MSQDLERELVARYGVVAGVDEVGRGALAGPVSVGVCCVDATTSPAPRGLNDSKQVRPAAREALVEPVRAWAVAGTVGHASPREIDTLGIVGALRLAGLRALAEVAAAGVEPGIVLLDGSHDWLSSPPDLFGDAAVREALARTHPAATPLSPAVQVRTVVKGDAEVAVIAGASILAKVERDALMVAAPDPGYGWARNKGYAAAAHRAGLAQLGASDFHRLSWRLPGLAS